MKLHLPLGLLGVSDELVHINNKWPKHTDVSLPQPAVLLLWLLLTFLYPLLKKISQIFGRGYELVSLQFAFSIGNSLADCLAISPSILFELCGLNPPGFLSSHLFPAVEVSLSWD